MLRDRWWFGRATKAFTLQWHLTNACPLRCRHCYDRSPRSELTLADALQVLEDLRAFGRRHGVEPRICLTGGDPLLYPHFWELYVAIAEAGLPVSILGNPAPASVIRRLLKHQRPLYYQVSLEGLREHNDAIRGPGHFERTTEFLADAREAGLRTGVMLTLTRANLDQVVPLGTWLGGRTGRFNFNRVSQVGEASNLEAVTPVEFTEFLRQYLAARRQNPVLGVKDNLFNILREHYDRPRYGGCTGYGCGAAFNFVALLPDGEVHACRKFASPLGHLRESGLEAIYASRRARRYRRGPDACHRCRLRDVCRGCPAVVSGNGLDPFVDRDPYCFRDRLPRGQFR